MNTIKQINKNYELKSLDEALSLIKILLEAEAALSLTVLSLRAGLTKNKAFRILKTLERNNFVEMDSRAKYFVGPTIYWAARNKLFQDQFLFMAQPIMKKICEAINESVYFAKEIDGRLMLIDLVDCRRVIKAASFLGAEIPCSRMKTSSYVEKNDQFANGVTVGFGVIAQDITTVSIDVVGHSGQRVGAILVLAPSYRLSISDIEEKVIPALHEASRAIPQLVGKTTRLKSLSLIPEHDSFRDESIPTTVNVMAGLM